MFRAGVVSVVLDVTVTSRNDAPVTDLTAVDFELRDSGRLQTIMSCEHVVIPPRRQPIDLKAPPPVIVDVATNTTPTRDSRAFVFVVVPGVDSAARRVMPVFLQSLSPADQAALVFVYQSRRTQDFTNDLGRLISAVNAPAAYDPTVDDGLRLTLDALSNSIAALAAAPQTRKAIVLLSRGERVELAPNTRNARGQVIDGLSLAKQRSRAMDFVAFLDKARQAGIPVYTINPDTTTMVTRVGGPADSARDFLISIASETRGLAYTNQDPLEAARRVMADNSEYYVLTYTPTPYAPDGTFHDLAVSVPGRPGVRVRTRRGYFARQATGASDPTDRLRHLLEQAQPGGDLSLRMFGVPVARDPHGARVLLVLDAEYSEASPAASSDQLTVRIVAHDLEGKVLANETRTLTVPLAGRRPPFAVTFREAVTLPAVRVGVRLAASSRALGLAGVVHLPIDLTDFARSGVTITPLLLSRVDAPGFVAQDQSVLGLIPFEPTTQRTFSLQDSVQMFARVLDVDPARLQLTLAVRPNGGTPTDLTAIVGRSNGSRSVDIRSQDLPLKQFGVGAHVLQLLVRSNGKPVAERALTFRVQ